jgi:DNA-directed RNA polymerase sigma subunit (sigma70/sigma32)
MPIKRNTKRKRGKGEKMTVQELAEETGVTKRRVYQIAQKLGRLPTVAEIESRKGKRGRPKKYKWEESDE